MYSTGREKNFIFVHIPKTAGASVKNYMRNHVKPEQLHECQVFNTHSHSTYHAVLTDYMISLDSETYTNAFKFSIVRNPWDRVVSLYHWKKDGTPNEDYLRVINSKDYYDDGVHTQQKPKATILNTKTRQHPSFEEFVKNFMDLTTPLERILYAEYFRPYEMDFIIKYEDLQTDFNQVCYLLGLPQAELLHIHKTAHDDYRQYYNEETALEIRRLFYPDTLMFDYKF